VQFEAGALLQACNCLLQRNNSKIEQDREEMWIL
jgi:hypothetical protein